MSGETQAEVSGWTVDTLRAHVRDLIEERDRRYNERFIAQEKAVEAALTSAKEAVLKAEGAAERRFESVNEFRNTLADQARDLMPRLETEALIKNIEEKVTRLERRDITRSGEHTGRENLWAYAVGAVGLLGGVVGIALALVGR